MASTSPDILARVLAARSTAQIEVILASLPVVPPEQYQWVSADEQSGTWQPGKLHWVPVGRDRGNGGRIKLAGEPMNPLAERLVNGMESLIELERLRELQKKPNAPMPVNPRDAVQRYFGFPRLDVIERLEDQERKEKRALADKVRKNLTIVLDFEKKSKQFAVTIRDHGMGQAPGKVHTTLLSLGRTDKADKPYLIGVFGQGGSSAFSIAKYSVVVGKGEYIEVDPEELEAIALESKRTIEIDEFVPKDQIDVLYMNNPYFIVPDGEVGAEAFAVIREAINK